MNSHRSSRNPRGIRAASTHCHGVRQSTFLAGKLVRGAANCVPGTQDTKRILFPVSKPSEHQPSYDPTNTPLTRQPPTPLSAVRVRAPPAGWITDPLPGLELVEEEPERDHRRAPGPMPTLRPRRPHLFDQHLGGRDWYASFSRSRCRCCCRCHSS